MGKSILSMLLKVQLETMPFRMHICFQARRGTGKTSVARIFADSIGTSSNDLYEIDGASNRKIEHVRELREGVATLSV